MGHTDIHQEAHSPEESLPRLLYALNDKPPFKDSLFVGLQHVCAIFIPVCTRGLLITTALGLDSARASYILGMSYLCPGFEPSGAETERGIASGFRRTERRRIHSTDGTEIAATLEFKENTVWIT
jgi:xanthine permease XanP